MPRQSSKPPPRPRGGRPAPDDSADTLQIALRGPKSEDVGRIINNRYKITDLIGEGGMGVVYEALDMQVDRRVAIKLVRRECLNDNNFLTRFRRELEITTQFRHPSTIRVYEHGETVDGRPYMVMELLTGESLAELLERTKRVPEMQSLSIARQIAESLSEAHEHEIFHRDLKPDNIFIESVGVSTVVKVLDFGIAGGFDAMRLTKAGEVFGTPQYMSPEQCNGQPLDYRTDIYSLGCILYELLEGRPPFSAETPMATMLKHVRSKVPPPRHCSEPTARLLKLALRKDRNKRIQTMGRFTELVGECMGAVRAQTEGTPAPELKIRRPTMVPGTGPNSQSTTPITSLHQNASAAAGMANQGNAKLVVILLGVGALALLLLMFFMQGNNATSDKDKKEADTKGEVAAGGDEGEAGSSSTGDEGELPKIRKLVATNVEAAEVLVDGDVQCTTPCEIEVTVGDGKTHEIRLRKEGYIDVVQNWSPKSTGDKLPTFPPMNPLQQTIEVGKKKKKRGKKRKKK